MDDNEYIDYRLAYGPYILGYADERVDRQEGMEIGGVFALIELEYEVAKKISSMVPSAELVRYSNSGTEAVMAALRVGRAVSKDGYIMLKEVIMVFGMRHFGTVISMNGIKKVSLDNHQAKESLMLLATLFHWSHSMMRML